MKSKMTLKEHQHKAEQPKIQLTFAKYSKGSASHSEIHGGTVRKLGVVIFAHKEEVSAIREGERETAKGSPFTGSKRLWI